MLSHALRETLLGSARRDLGVIRRQLSFPLVAWNTFWRRDERGMGAALAAGEPPGIQGRRLRRRAAQERRDYPMRQSAPGRPRPAG